MSISLVECGQGDLLMHRLLIVKLFRPGIDKLIGVSSLSLNTLNLFLLEDSSGKDLINLIRFVGNYFLYYDIIIYSSLPTLINCIIIAIKGL